MLTESDAKRLSEELQRHLIKLIQIDTTNPPGNEIVACNYIKEQLEAEGLECEIFESAPTRGNLVCRIKGDGSKRPVTIAGHLDVVPAAKEFWSVDPFGGEVKDGFIYGRGSLDMKFTVAMQMTVFMELKRRKIPLKRDVILLCVADEEMSGTYGMAYMVKNHFDKIDCEFEINEGGGYAIPLEGKNMYFCQPAEKGVCWFKVTTKGESGHGAVPRADNSVVQMAKALQKLAEPMPARQTEIVKTILNELATKVLPFPKGFALKQIFNPLLTKTILGAIGSANKDVAETISAMMRDTVSPTIVKGGSKENVIPEKCEAIIDCRILPGQTAVEFRNLLKSKVNVEDISLLLEEVPDPTESPMDTELYRAIERVVAKHDPTGVVIPFLMTGATDSRFFRKKGVTAYGFIPFKSSVPPDKYLPTIHSVDERVPIDGLDFGVKMFYDLMTDLCG
ncbi:MAG: M20/M25/M40 family metallo-hydrolase [bacterium]